METNAYFYRMVKKIFFLIFISFSTFVFSQDIVRVKVEGRINVPNGEDAEGISVYNVSSQKGTVTNEEGNFEIDVAENDRLQIFALQYKTFTVVIDKGVVDKKKLNIFVNPAITQLDEVVVSPYDLSGNINADIEKIPTYSIGKDWDLSYASMEYGYNFQRDKTSAIQGNAAEEALNINHLTDGLNFVSILGGVSNLLFPKGKRLNPKDQVKNTERISNNMQERFSQEFIHDNFGIPREKTTDFLFYAQENGLEEHLLRPEQELELMTFLQKKSKDYIKLSE